MLSKGEAAALLSLINAHHGNAQWDDVQLDAFHSELRSDITAVEAREAVRRFYADNSTGRWCGSGDINGIVRKLRNGAKRCETVRSADRPGVRTSGTSGRSGVVVSPAAHDGPFPGRVSTGGVDCA